MVRNDNSFYQWLPISQEASNNLGMSTFTESLAPFGPNTSSAQSEFELWFDTKKEILDDPFELGTSTLPKSDMTFHYITIPKYSALFLNVMNNIEFEGLINVAGNIQYQVFDQGGYIGKIFSLKNC